ncbi:(2Fe-2S)-binding protein [Pseudogracilibacillus sp. ICA-222130]|uniref:(2Fe-2S)-binding protein n=1 Tax=Pseudogracilibacillus sp. ICA-222130 TaxID=3134655 RepID=UPI0030C47B78
MQQLTICRCEEVTLAELEETAKKFNCTARELKLRTRAGMGFCGGRTCRPAVDKVISDLTNEHPTDNVPLKVAPPVRPISLQDLGGEGNND